MTTKDKSIDGVLGTRTQLAAEWKAQTNRLSYGGTRFVTECYKNKKKFYILGPFFYKLGQSRPLFVYFLSFLITISIQIEKSIDGGLVI